jgi:hypothetical protein
VPDQSFGVTSAFSRFERSDTCVKGRQNRLSLYVFHEADAPWRLDATTRQVSTRGGRTCLPVQRSAFQPRAAMIAPAAVGCKRLLDYDAAEWKR